MPKSQLDLLAQLQAGATLHYMRNMGSLNPRAYYYTSLGGKRVTLAAEALIKKGYVLRTKTHGLDFAYALSEKGLAFGKLAVLTDSSEPAPSLTNRHANP